MLAEDEGDADRAAILEAINAHRIAIWMRDYAAWERCFVQEPYAGRWAIFRGGGFACAQGWSDIAERGKAFIASDPKPYPHFAYDTKIVNLKLQVDADTAWATYEQHFPPPVNDEGPAPGISKELRILERRGGVWKIAFMGFVASAFDNGVGALIRTDAQARVLWSNQAALKEFERGNDLMMRNELLRARNRKVDQKLQAAIRWVAERDNAHLPMNRAEMPIVMESGTGYPTRVCWVSNDGGLLLVSLSDQRGTAQRLNAAGRVYGLSPAQVGLAIAISEGLSLREAAERAGTSVNTARTHLQRIYEKTGVRSEPALVRMLLSSGAVG